MKKITKKYFPGASVETKLESDFFIYYHSISWQVYNIINPFLRLCSSLLSIKPNNQTLTRQRKSEYFVEILSMGNSLKGENSSTNIVYNCGPSMLPSATPTSIFTKISGIFDKAGSIITGLQLDNCYLLGKIHYGFQTDV